MNAVHGLVDWLGEPAFHIAGKPVPWSDLFGNVLALATLWLALRRLIWAWPVQMAGSVLLLVANWSVQLGGSASRQVLIIAMAGYGWYRWAHGRRSAGDVVVRFATPAERVGLVAGLAAGTVGFALLLQHTGASWAPWPDAYIFVGTFAATVAQARGLVEFWFVWIAVDLVGVPLAVSHGLVFSGLVYGVFLVLVLVGMRDWWHRSRRYREETAARERAATEQIRVRRPATAPDGVARRWEGARA